MSIGSMAPITATQFGSHFAYNRLHHVLTGRATLTQPEKLATGFLAGATSAVLANPTELVVIKQQQSGRALGAEIRDTVMRLGPRGMGVGIYATMLREGIYGCCWMEVRDFCAPVCTATALHHAFSACKWRTHCCCCQNFT